MNLGGGCVIGVAGKLAFGTLSLPVGAVLFDLNCDEMKIVPNINTMPTIEIIIIVATINLLFFKVFKIEYYNFTIKFIKNRIV